LDGDYLNGFAAGSGTQTLEIPKTEIVDTFMLCPRYAFDAFRSVNQQVNVGRIVIKTARCFWCFQICDMLVLLSKVRYAFDSFRSVNQGVNVSRIVIKTGIVTTEVNPKSYIFSS